MIRLFRVAVASALMAFTVAALSGGASGQELRRGMGGGAGDMGPGSKVAELVRAQESEPTSAVNVEERLEKLTNVLRMLGNVGAPGIETILTLEKQEEINSLIKSGDKEKAAALVSDSISRLPRRGADRGGAGRQRRMAGAPAPLGMEGLALPIREPECPQPPDTSTTGPIPPSYENGTFGFLDAVDYKGDPFTWNLRMPEYLADLNTHWMRTGGLQSFIWRRIQSKDASGGYSDYKWDYYDCMVKNIQARNIHILGNIKASEPGSSRGVEKKVLPSLPKDMSAYAKFVEAVVERYDADGINDMPGLKYPLKYWLIEEEPFMDIFWNGTGEDYAVLLDTAYGSVKRADNSAKVICAAIYPDGKAHMDFAERFFSKLASISGGKPRYDYIDVHWYFRDGDMQNAHFARFKSLIDALYGLERKFMGTKTPFMSLEVAGQHTPEDAHALDVVKRNVYALALGARKVFWETLVGLDIKSDWLIAVSLIVRDRDGREVKKPAYHSYKAMAARMEFLDHASTEIIRDSGGVVLAKFQRDGQRFWVGWSDKGAVKEKITAVPYGKVKLTKIGANGAGAHSEVMVSGGEVDVTLTEEPLFVEKN